KDTRRFNRLSQQLSRDGHLTFGKKYRDLIMQIFGHEALLAQEDTPDIAHCIFFDVDIHRFSAICLEHLAWRKLGNPFKWLEFLLTAPLEMLSWSLQRFIGYFGRAIKKFSRSESIQNKIIKSGILLIPQLLFTLLSIGYPFLNLAVNLATGL